MLGGNAFGALIGMRNIFEAALSRDSEALR